MRCRVRAAPRQQYSGTAQARYLARRLIKTLKQDIDPDVDVIIVITIIPKADVLGREIQRNSFTTLRKHTVM